MLIGFGISDENLNLDGKGISEKVDTSCVTIESEGEP